MIQPEPSIIDQDDQTQIRVQAVVHGDARRLDVRIWRRGPNGTTPSRTALTVEAGDLIALQAGLQELLDVSNGGQAAARVVRDNDEGRRLRAETVPFGTRYLAKLAFWQRVRDTWRPVDDGLVLSADHLVQLKQEVMRFADWIQELADAVPDSLGDALERHALQRWPSPGADWLTIERRSVAFHPLGVRVTANLSEEGEQNRLYLRQWKRDHTLWVPSDGALYLTIIDLDALLAVIGRLADAQTRSEDAATEEIILADGSTLRIGVQRGDGGDMLLVEHHAPTEAAAGTYFERRLSIPSAHLSRFGRMLLHSGSLLAARLTPEERAALQDRAEASPSVAAYDDLPRAPEMPSVRHGHAHSAGTEALKRIMFGTVPAPSSGTSLYSARQGMQATDEMPAIKPAPEPIEAEVQEPPAPPPPPIHLGDVHLGENHVSMDLRDEEPRAVVLTWENRTLPVPLGRMESLIIVLRDLYYKALRGQRGLPLAIADDPSLTVSVHNQGTQVFFALRLEQDGAMTRLTFPAGEVPVFLDAARAALATIKEGDLEHESRHSDD